jgi:hypothetical protein
MGTAVTDTKRRRLILLVLLSASTVAASGPAAEAAEPAPCAASFHVLHNDSIGSLPVAAGQYQLRADGVSCAQASSLFAQFLSDYDGVLPKPWRYNGENTFTRSTDSATITFVAQSSPADQGGGSHGALACPGSFRVLHDDRVGRLSIPRGQYRVTPLGGGLTCADANRLFARFLRRLGNGWTVLTDSGEFVRRSSHDGFRIKALD